LVVPFRFFFCVVSNNPFCFLRCLRVSSIVSPLCSPLPVLSQIFFLTPPLSGFRLIISFFIRSTTRSHGLFFLDRASPLLQSAFPPSLALTFLSKHAPLITPFSLFWSGLVFAYFYVGAPLPVFTDFALASAYHTTDIALFFPAIPPDWLFPLFIHSFALFPRTLPLPSIRPPATPRPPFLFAQSLCFSSYLPFIDGFTFIF